MHAGDLLNIDMLKEAIEQPFLGTLWVDGDSGMMTPFVCEEVFGDGMHLLTVSTINQRPNYHVVRVDSGWREGRIGWKYYRDDTIGEHIDDVLTAIEEECGRVGEPFGDNGELCPDCDEEYCACNVDSGEQFPALDEDMGCSWGYIRWDWLMKEIGYTAMIDRLCTPATLEANSEGEMRL
jgi:hypothetical protein